MKNSTPRENFQSVTTEFPSKIPNRKKVSNEDFNHCEEETSTPLHKIIKSINSQTSNTFPGNDGLKAVFYKRFSDELVPVLLDVYNSWGKRGTKVLLLQQESCLPHIKKLIKEILKTVDPLHF